MIEFVYQVGMATGRGADERRAYLIAFGLNLKIERSRRGLSQEELANRIGMHRTFVGQLERGQRGVNVVELPSIARALGMRQAELLPELVDGADRHSAGSRRPSPTPSNAAVRQDGRPKVTALAHPIRACHPFQTFVSGEVQPRHAAAHRPSRRSQTMTDPRTTAPSHRSYFDSSLAELFDRYTGLWDRVDDRFTNWLLANLPDGPGHNAVDLGCGAGRHSILLAEHYGHVLAVDVADQMLQIACRNRAHPAIDYERRAVREVTADADDSSTWSSPLMRCTTSATQSTCCRMSEGWSPPVAPSSWPT
jgi:transcriptional regulator with XRE-family HTH domain